MGRVVAPGAEVLLKAIEPYDPELNPNSMGTEQWVKLADAFHEWHFKPDVLEDETFVQHNILEDYQNTAIVPNRELSQAAQLLLDAEEEIDEDAEDIEFSEAATDKYSLDTP